MLTNIIKPFLLLGLLYLFICSLDVLSSAFQLVGGKTSSYNWVFISTHHGTLALLAYEVKAYLMCVEGCVFDLKVFVCVYRQSCW